MSLITKTGVVVLRTVEYSESSLIVTVLSRRHGRISLIAKGARKPKSKFAGLLQPGRILGAVYYYKPTRSVQTLTEASLEHRLDTLSLDVEKMALVMSALELISQLVHEGEGNEQIYRFTERFLVWLEEQQEVQRTLFPYIQVRLAQLMGFGIQIGEISPGAESGYLNIEDGVVAGHAISQQVLRLTRNQLEFLLQASDSRDASVLKKELVRNELRSLIDHLDKYFMYHFDGLRPRRSDAIFDQILKDQV